MTILWFLYATYDMLRPLDKQIKGGEESAGFAILIMPCMLIDVVLITIYHFIF